MAKFAAERVMAQMTKFNAKLIYYLACGINHYLSLKIFAGIIIMHQSKSVVGTCIDFEFSCMFVKKLFHIFHSYFSIVADD